MKLFIVLIAGLLLSATLYCQDSSGDPKLMAHWKMDETSGFVLFDSSGNRLDAALHNTDASVHTGGVFGNGIYLNGSDQDASVLNADLLKCTSVTVTAWVKLEIGISDWRWVAGHGDNYGLVVNRFGNGGVFFYFYDGSTWPGLNADGVDIRDGHWHHLAASYNNISGFVNLFLDGKMIRSEYKGKAIDYSKGTQFTIGSMMGNRNYKGWLDDIRVYNGPLSLEEINRVMNNDAPAPVISNGLPSGHIPTGTRDTLIQIETDVPADCKYDNRQGVPFSEMQYQFSMTGDTMHSSRVTGLEDDKEYSFYCRCRDAKGYVNLVDYPISFSVEDMLPLTSSDIPLVVISTEGGVSIVDEPKVTAHLKIIDNGNNSLNHFADTGNVYDGKIGIEIRGAYSATLPQKPYLFETRTDSGTNNNVPLLGMPEENDWILLANYNDKSFVRNSLAFELFRKMGLYAPRSRYCEVFINEEYQGIYLLTEKIKRDKNRVDIAKLNETDNEGDQLTGGYIIKTDYYNNDNSWESKYPPFDNPTKKVHFVYYYPKADRITQQQKDYIHYFIDTFEGVMHSETFNDPETGYTAYIYRQSFVDYFLISELSRNVDAYKKSRYFYKDKDSNGGKLISGPAWDFDWAWKNIYDCPVFSRTDGSGWSYEAGATCNLDVTPPMYMVRLLEDKDFKEILANRYVSFRKTFMSKDSIFHFIDSVASYLSKAQKKHYDYWETLGKKVGAPEVEPAAKTYEEEVQRLKDWISLRLAWLDENMPGQEYITSTETVKSGQIFRVFPNPASDQLYIESDRIIQTVTFYNLSGLAIFSSGNLNTYSFQMNVSNFLGGVYLIRVETVSGMHKILKVVIR